MTPEILKKISDAVMQILGAVLPNHVYVHPRVEIVSTVRWKKIATFDKATVFWNLRIIHTDNGEGVLLAFRDLGTGGPGVGTDRKAIGPYFGDAAAVVAGAVPTTSIERRLRVNHVYAKLDVDYWFPSAGEPREFGPVIVVEEHRMFKRQGDVDEEDMEAPDASTEAFLREVEKEQERVKRELEREQEQVKREQEQVKRELEREQGGQA